MTSEDVAFSVMAVKQNHPFQTMLAPVDNVETPDPHTAVLHVPAASGHPAGHVAGADAGAAAHLRRWPGPEIASAQFGRSGWLGAVPTQFKPGQEIVLERFDKFFLPGKPYLDRVVVKINPDATNLLIGLERGDVQALPY